VLPAHTGKRFEEMAVSDGVAASREYVREAFGDEAPAERQEGRKRLEVHCEFDTSGMLAIVRQPQEMVSAA
jgi:hypothetical protein